VWPSYQHQRMPVKRSMNCSVFNLSGLGSQTLHIFLHFGTPLALVAFHGQAY
jgi:hypothetical protein